MEHPKKAPQSVSVTPTFQTKAVTHIRPTKTAYSGPVQPTKVTQPDADGNVISVNKGSHSTAVPGDPTMTAKRKLGSD